MHKSPERKDWRKTSRNGDRIHNEVPSEGQIWMVDRNCKQRCTEERMERELNMVRLRTGKGKNTMAIAQMQRREDGERAEYGSLENRERKTNTMTMDQGDKSEAQGFFKFIFFN